ncbi:MAG: thiamine diphosphokinase [Patescibacteria group bacterium]|jgi:thiamine pyrophosphokinase
MKRAIIFVNGNLSDLGQAKKIINKEDCLIAADGGVKRILELELTPHIVIGDFDSISNSLYKKLTKICKEQKSLFPTMIKYPRKKDKTDFELAIDYCLKNKFKKIIIFGILGDRIDHMMANIFLIAKIQTQNPKIQIKIIEGSKEIFILNKEIVILGKIGDEVSIIPISEKIKGIVTDGLEYQLKNDSLLFGSTRGVSNVMNKAKIKINVSEGIAVVEHNSQ